MGLTHTSSTDSFYKYMKRFHKNSNTAYGDLAKDMIEDKSFPKKIHYTKDEYTVIKKYLLNKNASINAINTFIDAYHEYLQFKIK